MNKLAGIARRFVRPLLSGAAILVLFVATRATDSTRTAIPADVGERFRFRRVHLPDVAGEERRAFRHNVHPSLRRLQGFISTVGASVALNDFDGDGLSNDVAYIDTRTDQVLLAPAPGTAPRYAPFAIEQGRFFDRRSMAPSSVIPADFNEDGAMDLLVLYAGRTPVLFLRRAPAMNAAAFRAQPLVASDEAWTSTCASVADYDGDSRLDLVVGNYFRDGYGIYTAEGGGVVQLPYSQARAANGGGAHFFRQVAAAGGPEPFVRYERVTDALPPDINQAWSLAIGSYDLDGDLRPEVYFANDFGPDRLVHNVSTPGRIRFRLVEGERSFTKPISRVLGRDAFKSMGIDFGDLNGDGLPDMYVSNVTVRWGGYENQQAFLNTGERGAFARGVAPFRESAEALGIAHTGWAWDVRLADFDNDGAPEALQAMGFIQGTRTRWPELQELSMANDVVSHIADWSWPSVMQGDDISGHEQNPFFVKAGQSYVDVAAQIGFGETAVSRGLATGDVDGDGRLDVAVANMWAPSTFYHNVAPATGAFLGLRIRQAPAGATRRSVLVVDGHSCSECGGPAAVGAAAEVLRADGRRLAGQVDGGSGHTGKRAPELLFGLGPHRSEAPVVIRWRDAGGVRMASLRLKPGWYTIVLPAGDSRLALNRSAGASAPAGP